jgi:hypothetical protein
VQGYTGAESAKRALNISKNLQSGIARIMAFSDQDFISLTSALEQISDLTDVPTSVQWITSKVSGVSATDALVIIRTLTGLSMGFRAISATIQDFVERVSLSVELAAQPSDYKENNLQDRLKSLLTLGSINLGAKAILLFSESERLVGDIRITSDLRPVFHDDLTAGIAGTMLVNTLRIEYMKDNERKSFIAVLDLSNVHAIRDACSRLLEKADSIESLSRRGGLPFLRMLDPGNDM